MEASERDKKLWQFAQKITSDQMTEADYKEYDALREEESKAFDSSIEHLAKQNVDRKIRKFFGM